MIKKLDIIKKNMNDTMKNDTWIEDILYPVPNGYKLLEPGDIFCEGDICFSKEENKWITYTGYIDLVYPINHTITRGAKKIKND